MNGTLTAKAREGAVRTTEDGAQSALNFVHSLLANATTPLALETVLARLAKAFHATSAGSAGLLGEAPVVQREISADGHALPGLGLAPEKWRHLVIELRRTPTSITESAGKERSLLVTGTSPLEGTTWLFWVEDEARRVWHAEDQAALALAGLAIERCVLRQKGAERFTAWLDRTRRQQKLEDAAAIVARLAHDFNNVLTGIMGFTELSLGHLAPGTLPHQFATEVHHSARNGSDFVAQLSNFSRRNASASQPTSLAAAVGEEVSRVEKAWGKAVAVHAEVPDDLPQVTLEAGALKLILTYLLENAREAITSAGTVTILARPYEMTPTDALDLLGTAIPGNYVALTVADNGTGFSAVARQRVLVEPFFSTKPRHRGLGLAATYGVLCSHGGGLRLEHPAHGGTGVHLFLPVIREETPAHAPRRSGIVPAKGEKLLVVDDDPLTLRLMCTTLERAGYRVESAVDGAQALDSYDKASEPFHLILSDVVMPRMTGFELAQRLLDHNPSVNVLFTSGHIPAGMVPENFTGRNFDPLPKPFRPEGLLRAVRGALERDGQRSASS